MILFIKNISNKCFYNDMIPIMIKLLNNNMIPRIQFILNFKFFKFFFMILYSFNIFFPFKENMFF
jgi:hypothetical protein